MIGVVVALALTAAVAGRADAGRLRSPGAHQSLAALATLTSLMLWCAERRGLPPLDAPLQRVVAWTTAALVTYVVSR